jgi:phosphatidylinositol alpha-mannosyltransferase
LRIGFFNTSLPQPERKPGGVDVYVDRLASKLVERGHELTFFSYESPAGPREYRHVLLTPAADAASKFRRLGVVPWRLNGLDTGGLDALHLHGDDWFFLRRRLPTVRTFYGSARHEARHATSRKRQLSQAAVYGLEIVSSRLASASYGLIPGDGAAYRTAGHLPLAIDLPPDAGTQRPQTPRILFVGTWRGRKRGQLLADAFSREVLPAVPSAELVMVSDECEPRPGVVWKRRPSDAELVDLYRNAHVFCLPSSYEGFGLPYIEAMAHGTPVVATPNPGSRFVLDDGRHGALVDEGDLGGTLRELLTDEPRRLTLANAGRQRARDFAWGPILNAHEAAYERAIDAWSCRRA